MVFATPRQPLLLLLLAKTLSATHASTKGLRQKITKIDWVSPIDTEEESVSLSSSAPMSMETEFPDVELASMSMQYTELSIESEEYVFSWDTFIDDRIVESTSVSPLSGEFDNAEEVSLPITTDQTGTSSSSPVGEFDIAEEVSLSTTADLTGTPSSSPVESIGSEDVIKHSSLVQYEMQIMTRTMNEYELQILFQPTCIEFLTQELKYEEGQISNIDCKVTNQQLLSGVYDESATRLKFTSLLVDINVNGNAAIYTQLNDMVNRAFGEKSELFVNSLKNKGEKAEVSTFNLFYSMTPVQQTHATVSSGSSDPVQQEAKTGSLIVIVTGVGLIVALVAGFAVRSRNNVATRAFEVPAVAPLGPDRIIQDDLEKEETLNCHAGFLNTLSDASEMLSPVFNMLSPGGGTSKVRREVIVPKGKLGVVTEDTPQGIVVHTVREGSPLEGLVFPGDLIEALDDMDVSHLSSTDLTNVMVNRSDCKRKLTVLSERLHANFSD